MRDLRFFLAATLLAGACILAPSVPAVAQPPAETIKINEKGFTPNETCAKCHTAIHDMWKSSMHAQSVTDPIFRASYMEAYLKSGGEAAKLCLRCHAPTLKAAKGANPDIFATSDGITCDFCHSVKDVDLKKPSDPFTIDHGLVKYGPGKREDVKQHKTAYSKLHTGAVFCASCHEYSANGVSIMSTYSEWKDSPYAEEGKPCQYCHMPEIPGEISNNVAGERGPKVFSHQTAGGHSMAQLQKAVAARIGRVERSKDKMTVFVDVTNVGSGHRAPTGMPSRKLILYCEVRAPGGKVYRDKILYEKAIFDKNGSELTSDADMMLGMGVTIAKDNRIFPKETRKEKFTFYIPDGHKASVFVWVDYLYTPMILQETEMRVEMSRDQAESGPPAQR